MSVCMFAIHLLSGKPWSAELGRMSFPNASGWHNSCQRGVNGITYKLILQYDKKNTEVYKRDNNWPKTLPCDTPGATLTSLLDLIQTASE